MISKLRNKKIDTANFKFVTNALKMMDPKGSQFIVALGMNEQGEIMVMSNSRMTDNQVYKILIEAARSIDRKTGRIITL